MVYNWLWRCCDVTKSSCVWLVLSTCIGCLGYSRTSALPLFYYLDVYIINYLPAFCNNFFTKIKYFFGKKIAKPLRLGKRLCYS